MKKLFFAFFLLPIIVFGQDSLQVQTDSLAEKKETSLWKKTNEVGFDLSQVSFINWSIGGENSISVLLKGRFERRYEKDLFSWNNDLTVRYGINKQDDREMRKTDDIFQFESTAGFKMTKTSDWSYSSKFSFNTQFTRGYAYPNTDVAISNAFAPAYVFLGVGAEYFLKKEEFKLYISPLTVKSTMVLNQRLADQGSFGVKAAQYDEQGNRTRKGKLHKTEIGFLITNSWKKKVYENINFENRLSVYSDYYNNFGNIDLDWQMQFDFEVNKHVKANINIHLIYDDDVKTKEEVNGEVITLGPKLQIKQAIGLGLTYKW